MSAKGAGVFDKFRLSIIFATAFLLSGCFDSKYDISQQLEPQFPIKVGEYRSQDGRYHKRGVVLIVSRDEDGYRVLDENNTPNYLRFFRVGEFDYYIVQMRAYTGGLRIWVESYRGQSDSPPEDAPQSGKKSEETDTFYVYWYARITENEVKFFTTGSKRLPEYLQKLVTQRKKSDERKSSDSYKEYHINKGPADTLYVLREVGRRGIGLKLTETYALK
jgi:hypothetical protein